MSEAPQSRINPWLFRIASALLILGASIALPTSPASADRQSAERVLKSMSDYMAGQPQLSARFDVALDIITPEIEKIQFAASGEFLLSRPNNILVSRVGGYSDVQLFFDGRTATIVDRGDRKYANLAMPGTVDQLVDRLRQEHSMQMPGFDLLLTNSYAALMADVVEANHIGVGIIGGVECEHLAFRNADVDWQIWIRSGDRPLPCRYVITSKTVAGAPEYIVQFRDWSTTPTIARNAFNFTPPSGATLVPFSDLDNIGELPPPAPFSKETPE